MGYSRYVGRVGALAIALGVGVAVPSVPGVAWADDAATGEGTSAPQDPGPSTPESDQKLSSQNESDGADEGPPPGASVGGQTATTGNQTSKTFGRAGGPQVTISGRTVDLSGVKRGRSARGKAAG